jgi:hypothetical protein
MVIECVVCEKKGTHEDVGNPPLGNGWRLAPGSRIGGYTCSEVCDDIVVAYDEKIKAEKEAAKKAQKAAKKAAQTK